MKATRHVLWMVLLLPGQSLPAQSAPKTLNNCVSELLSVPSSNLTATAGWRFTNPRTGWVFFRNTAMLPAGSRVRVWLAAAPAGGAPPAETLLLAQQAAGVDTQEGMRLLPAGDYELQARPEGSVLLRELVVRAIPELVFCKFQYNPLVPPHGPYDWAFLQRRVLTNVNCLVGSGTPEHRDFIASWKAQGKRWIVECGVPGLTGEEPVTAAEAYDYWWQNPGLRDPMLDGVIADEFLGGRSRRNYPAWTEAVRRIRADGTLRGRLFYPYCTSLYGEPAAIEFVQCVVDAGYPFAWERYLPEPATEAEAQKLLAGRLTTEMQRWQRSIPGCVSNLVVCLGYMSMPTTETLNLDPQVDFKVWMDLQFQHLATAPAFAGLYGLMEYTSGYADEETVRWAARLYRHYGMEGKTDLLSARLGYRYRLDYVQNPDFAEGTQHWQVKAAEPGAVEVKSLKGYAWLQGRYPRTSRGDTFVWLKRSAAGPNLLAQPINDLRPGRLYSLKLVTADYQELGLGRSVEQRHALSISINGATWLKEKCFQQPMPNNYAHGLGPFDAQNKAWMNYHYRVFRAQTSTAHLSLADWADLTQPGGPISQELMVNFVELQPYLED